MSIKKYKQVRVITIIFMISIITVSTLLKLYLLTIISTFTGILFLSLVHTNNKNLVDERELSIQEKAADFTYSIFAPTNRHWGFSSTHTVLQWTGSFFQG